MTETERLKVAARDMLRAEGERRATVAIVAWLRDDAAKCDCFAHSEGECACRAWSDYKRVLETDIADRLECGEHLAAQEQETDQ
jgi:hypothetical protein